MSKIKVNFYNTISDDKLKYAVIVSKYQNKWIWCKHKERNTYEIPGGHRESEEDITDTAKRELYEETGAFDFDIKQICVYSVERDGEETFGMLFYAEISKLESKLHSEIERIELFDAIPEKLAYPLIQPFLYQRIQDLMNCMNH